MGILLSSAHNREFPLDPSKSGDVEFFEEEPTRYCLVEPVCEVSRSLSELVRMLSGLLSKSYEADLEESWENERTANVRPGVRRPLPSDRLFASRNNNSR